MEHQFINIHRVCEIVKLSPSHIYDRIKVRMFPTPVKDKHGNITWIKSEVMELSNRSFAPKPFKKRHKAKVH